MSTAAKQGIITVNLLNSKQVIVWDGSSSLLELIESAGVHPANNCRMGTCGTCTTKLSKGSVIYDPEPFMEPLDDNVLICCAKPTSDIEPDL